MGINRQDSRHRIKRSNLTGVVPTAHTASTDFTDGTWLNTDLREAEFFYNIPDKKLWIGTGTSSIEIAQIGSTSSGNSLEQTLTIGNDSGANNIIMGTATVIKSTNGNFQIVPDVGGVDVRHSINNGNDTELFWNGDYLSIRSINSGIEVYGGVDININTGPNSSIYLDNSSISLTTNANTESISIGGGKITEKATSINIVAGYPSMLPIPSTPGSLYLSAGTGSVYMASDAFMASGKTLNLDTYTTLKNTATIPGTLNQFDIKSSVGTATASIQLTTGLSTTIISTVQGISSTTTQEISENGGLKMSHTNGTDSGLTYQKIGAVSTTTVGTFSMASITFMANDQSFSIRGQANGYCASPNRNMGATFYASFLKYGGVIYQNGTTDIVLKDGYGDGTTPKVWTDGTNIYISVRTFSALTSTFTTSYEILV